LETRSFFYLQQNTTYDIQDINHTIEPQKGVVTAFFMQKVKQLKIYSRS
jgi:hypothetical protein